MAAFRSAAEVVMIAVVVAAESEVERPVLMGIVVIDGAQDGN